MTRLLLAISADLLADLAARPGLSKLDKEEAARPRQALHLVLGRLMRDLGRDSGIRHLRADVLEEPLHTRRIYQPGSLSSLLVNVASLARVPPHSAYAVSQPQGYVATFHYPRIGWALLAAYLELRRGPVIVFLRAMTEDDMRGAAARIGADRAHWDATFRAALAVAEAIP